eukprot:TRINITY_DN8940_c0_g2_i2.p1 TRINITY_DN8940_c0_g2~~TRINITY_DN8940_c0_g2_i2.p1  ORF type:complete len:248 (+),score=39.08 TRINITY_DN8940_c0_g2_i2:50-745(+)
MAAMMVAEPVNPSLGCPVPEPIIRDSTAGGTGNLTWCASHLMSPILLGMEAAAIAADEALASWRNIIATDGEPGVVRNMKYNVQANRLGHAVRCLRWDWADPAPKGIDAKVDLVIGCDVVYYKKTHRPLALALRRVLTAREPPCRALVLLTIRAEHDDGQGRVVHTASGAGYSGSSVQRFVEEELAEEGLKAIHMPIPEEAFDNIVNKDIREDLRSPRSRESFRLYEIVLM